MDLEQECEEFPLARRAENLGMMNEEFMKKLLIGLMALTSASAFANGISEVYRVKKVSPSSWGTYFMETKGNTSLNLYCPRKDMASIQINKQGAMIDIDPAICEQLSKREEGTLVEFEIEGNSLKGVRVINP